MMIKFITLLLSISTLHARPYTPEVPDSDRVAFLRAAKCGNISCLDKLIASGMDVNMRDKRGLSPLMHAVLSEKFDTDKAVDFLLEHGANPSIDAYDGSTPLHNAFSLGRLEIAKKIFASIMATPAVDPAKERPSITMLIADIKLGPNGEVTILELGEGPMSYFKGHDALYPKGTVWQRFWEYLSSKKVPIWYVGNLSTVGREDAEISLKGLKSLGGALYPSLHILEKDPTFKKAIERARDGGRSRVLSSVTPDSIRGGIVLLRHHTTNQAMLNYFKTTYPEIIIVDEVTRSFVNSKFMTNLLFEGDDQLGKFRPLCKTYKKGCTPHLVKTIHNDFAQNNLVVIKPLDSSNGWGVIIAQRHHLARELEKVFGSDNSFLKKTCDASYSYWLTDPNNQFIVEAYAPSKIVTVDKKNYDATMRQVFVIENGPNGITTTFLASYWKLPAVGINGAGTATERHKSNVKSGTKPSAIVAAQDDEVVREALRFIAPRIYMKMMRC